MPKYAEFQAFKEQNFITEADGDMLHREGIAITMAMGNAPQAVAMGFQREYVLFLHAHG